MRRSPAPHVPCRLSVSPTARRTRGFRRRRRNRGDLCPWRCDAPEFGPPAHAFAEAFARLIRLAPRPDEVSRLDPAPSRAAWNRAGDGLWPCPGEEPDVDLNEVVGAEWIDNAGRRARDRMPASQPDAVIGHCDWLVGSLRWRAGALLVVHDWDSVTADDEAVLVGFAAALYSTVSAGELATVEDTGRFLVVFAMRVDGSSARASSNSRGRQASGPGLTTPNIRTASGSPSPHCRRMRHASVSLVWAPARDRPRRSAAAHLACSPATMPDLFPLACGSRGLGRRITDKKPMKSVVT